MSHAERLPAEEKNFAAIAVELRLSELSMPELSYALLLEAFYCQRTFVALEQLAIKAGLPDDTARRVLISERRRVELVSHAHQIFKALIPHEATVIRLIEHGSADKPSPFRNLLNGLF